VVQDLLIGPLLPRFGVLANDCQLECLGVLFLRIQNPIELLGDLVNMDFNHPCRMYVEEKYPLLVEELEELHVSIAPTFRILRAEVLRYNDSLEDSEENAETKEELEGIAKKLGMLITSITKEDVVEFYSYYVTRGLYVQLGTSNFLVRL
jgi:hypothetical protein